MKRFRNLQVLCSPVHVLCRTSYVLCRSSHVLCRSAYALCVSAALLSACGDDADGTLSVVQEPAVCPPTVLSQPFATDDGAAALSTHPSTTLLTLLLKTGPSIAKDISYQNITPEQYAEIAAFTNELTAGLKDETEVYTKVFDWVKNTVEHDNADNDPYPVFKTHKGVCQGVSNLLTVMLHSQGIPVFNVNGMYDKVGGHAWNYVYVGNEWKVSDATNKRDYAAKTPSSYMHLIPYSTMVPMFEDEQFVYDFRDSQLNVCRVKASSDQLTVPFSVGGFRITSFNPQSAIPENVTELYVGANIKTLGEEDLGLMRFAPNLSAVYVAEDNDALESYSGMVYKKNGKARQLYFIPSHIEGIELLPMDVVEKNTIYNCAYVTAIVFPAGVKTIESYAVENCPSLRRVYVPVDAVIEPDAFYRCPSDVEIIRGDYTGIHHVTR